MKRITLTLKESGTLADCDLDFKIYAGATNNIILQVRVPKVIVSEELSTQFVDSNGAVATETGIFTAVKIGCIYYESNGKIGKTKNYYVRFIKEKDEFLIYERHLPNSFIKTPGIGENSAKLVVNVVNLFNDIVIDEAGNVIDNQTSVISNITSQIYRLPIEESTALDIDEEVEDPSELDLISGQVNSLIQGYSNKANRSETFLRCNLLEELPVNLRYEQDGFKTIGVLFQNAIHEVKNVKRKGITFVCDIDEVDDNIVQTEIFFYDQGVLQREITLNAETLEFVSKTDWILSGNEEIIGAIKTANEALRIINISNDNSANALAKSQTAVDVANSANSKSDSAVSASTQAVETSNSANTKSTTAEEQSQTAVQKAERAEETSNQAEAIAQSAEANSQTAIKTANEALQTIITQAGTKITENGVAVSSYEIDKKADKTYVDNLIAKLVDSAPETLDTLKELADAISEDQEVLDTLNEAIGTKVSKVDGKGLSTNDFTNTDKSNLDLNTTNRHTHSNKTILDSITAAFTTALKTKLDGIATGANKTVVDTAISSTSTNPVQNKVVYSELSKKTTTAQGSTNANKTMGTNSSGNITPLDYVMVGQTIKLSKDTDGGLLIEFPD